MLEGQRNIIVTGGTGFVGRQILRTLQGNDSKIAVIIRSQNSTLNNALPPQVESRMVDDLFSESITSLVELLDGFDTLVHAAWYTEPGKYLESTENLQCLVGTVQLAKAFAQAGGRRFIGIGTCFEYDPTPGYLTVQTPLVPNTLYAACKASAFHVLSHLFPKAGVEFTWCRLFYLYGEGEDSRRLVPYIRHQLSKGQVAELSSGRQIRDFLDVFKAGAMIASIALSDRTGAINICSGIPITVRQLAERIADEYGRRDLLKFGARPDNSFDPPCVVGVPDKEFVDL